MKSSPAFQWYPKDILSSARVAEMDLRTECCYRRALDYCWLNGSLPADPNKLANVIGKRCTAKDAERIIHMFIPDPNDAGKLIHDRLEEERVKQARYRLSASTGGKKSAAIRAQQREHQNGSQEPIGQPPLDNCLPIGNNPGSTFQSPSPSPSPTSSGDDDQTPSPSPSSFDGSGKRKTTRNSKPELSLEENKTRVLADTGPNGMVHIYLNAGMPEANLAGWLDAFHRHLHADGIRSKSEVDYNKHFRSWITMQPFATGNPGDYNPVNKSSPTQNQKSDDYLQLRTRLEEKTRALANN